MEALIARSIQVLIALGGAYILTLWFAIVVWTFQDIQARSRSVVAQIFSTLVVLIFSIPGLLIYMILRPRYTLDDAFQRSLEEEYLMQDLEELPLCPGCQQFVEDDWVFCPNCRTELRDNCISCDQLIDLRWEICPFCGTEQYEDEDMLPEPVMQPVLGPSPQYLGRPQLNQAEIFRLTEQEERTRPIIPATVRVDLRSGDIATEPVPQLPIYSPSRSFSGLDEPRRVSLEGNGREPGTSGDHLEPAAEADDPLLPEATPEGFADGMNETIEDEAGAKSEHEALDPASDPSEVSADPVEHANIEPEQDLEHSVGELEGEAAGEDVATDKVKRPRKRRSRKKKPQLEQEDQR
jgi:RNA polymerase subunit RPABC4/transcription elongation factor Spt4